MVRNARKWMCAVLAVVMMISMISICAFAEEPAPTTNVLYTEDLKVNGESLTEDQLNWFDPLEVTTVVYALNVEKNVANSVYIYKSNDGEQGEKVGMLGRMTQNGIITLELTNYFNDYILVLESEDGTETKSFDLRIERNAVIVEANQFSMKEEGGNCIVYRVPYEEDTIRVKFNGTLTGTVHKIISGTYQEVTPDAEGYYVFTFSEPDSYFVRLGIGEEIHYITVGREKNKKAEIEFIAVAGCAVEQETKELYNVTVPKDQTVVNLELIVSAEATVQVVNAFTGEVIEKQGTVYPITYTSNEDEPIGVVVTAQSGHMEAYIVALKRVKSAECQLISVEGATAVADGYLAKTDAKSFYVNAIVSAGACFELYADAECTQAIEDPFVELKAAKTDLYIMVVAENGYTVSAPVKLTVETTATEFNTAAKEDIYYQNFYNLDKVAVTGGIQLIEKEDVLEKTGKDFGDRGVIYVQGSAVGQKMHFAIEALGDYEPKGVRLYADVKKTILLENAVDLTPDSDGTTLYAVIEANGVKEEYVIGIISEMSYSFNDVKDDHWAKEYVEVLGELGILKGYTDGSFKGANKLTRNEMAALMVRLTGANKDLYSGVPYKFQDTTAEWAVPYVKAASRMGLIDGNPVTNAEGVVEGYTFNGSKNATRAEFLKVFGNAMLIHTEHDVAELYKELQLLIDIVVASKKFKDIEKVADWAKPYVYTAVAAGWIEGSSQPDGLYLNAGNEINRYEVAAIVSRANDLIQPEEPEVTE